MMAIVMGKPRTPVPRAKRVASIGLTAASVTAEARWRVRLLQEREAWQDVIPWSDDRFDRLTEMFRAGANAGSAEDRRAHVALARALRDARALVQKTERDTIRTSELRAFFDAIDDVPDVAHFERVITGSPARAVVDEVNARRRLVSYFAGRGHPWNVGRASIDDATSTELALFSLATICEVTILRTDSFDDVLDREKRALNQARREHEDSKK